MTWNVTFDLLVRCGVRDYLSRRAAFDAGLGPRVTIEDIMRPSLRRAAAGASVAGGCVAAAGLTTVALLTRRR